MNRLPRTKAVAATVLLLVAAGVSAFDLKGVTPGDPASSVDLKDCRKTADADSGIPGYRCDTTLGGYPARLSIAVVDERVTGLIYRVDEGSMTPLREAFEEKFGRARKPNRYIERYIWGKGELSMTMEETRGGRGFFVLSMHNGLAKVHSDREKAKAKKDF